MAYKYIAHEERVRYFTEPGDRFEKEYMLDPDTETLEIVGVKDLYESIQSFKDETDINNIIRRYISGDTSVVGESSGNYVDATNLPSDYRSILDRTNVLQSEYDKLDDNAKKNVTFEQFVNRFNGNPIFEVNSPVENSVETVENSES